MPLRKSADPRPQISQVTPPAAIAGGELQIRGKGFAKAERPRVTIGEVGAPVIIGSDSFVIARVPEGATAGELVIENGQQASDSWACDIGVLIAESLHPVANPAVDSFGNIYTTFSGSRGQKVPVAVYKIDLNFNMKPFINELMNATALAFDAQGMLYISSRYDGIVYQVTPNGNMSVYVEGMGVATGLAFDQRTQSVRRRPQRHHFQDQPQPPDLRLRHAGALHRRLPPGLRPGRLPLRHRPHHLQLRCGLPHLARTAKWRSSIADWAARRAWRSTKKAASTWPPPSPAARAWCASIPTGAPICSSPARHRGPGLHAFARPGGRHHQRALPRGCRHQGPAAALMNAEIIAVGSEMLTPERVDTNSLYLTGELNNLGVEVVTKCVIGDDRERLADAVRRALSRSEIVILSGGLGPTEDDLTREAVAQALDRKLESSSRDRRGAGAALRPHEAQDGGGQQAPGLRHRRRRRFCPTIAAPRPASGWRNPAAW